FGPEMLVYNQADYSCLGSGNGVAAPAAYLRWTLQKGATANGLIMQEVSRSISGSVCSGVTSGSSDNCTFPQSQITLAPKICEFWEVQGTIICEGSCAADSIYLQGQQGMTLADASALAFSYDRFIVNENAGNCQGEYSATGTAKFLP